MERAKRKKLPNSLRFEVFKRDKFTCQFCGRKAPDIVLEVDHLHPLAKGGGDDVLNLITSCFECNSGKSDRTLSDTAVLDKTRQQLEELQERREQLEMMVKWRESLANTNDTLLVALERQFTKESGYEPTDSDRATLRRLLREFGFDEVSQAMTIAADQYFRWKDDAVTPESVDYAFGKIGGICKGRRLERTNPEKAELYFALNIWKKGATVHSMTVARAMDVIRAAHRRGVSLDRIKEICGRCPGITRLEDELGSEPGA